MFNQSKIKSCKVWIVNHQFKKIKVVFISLEKRIFSYYHDDPRCECQVVINTKYCALIKDHRKDKDSPFDYSMMIIYDMREVLEFYHNDKNCIKQWVEIFNNTAQESYTKERFNKIMDIYNSNQCNVFLTQDLTNLKLYAVKIYNTDKQSMEATLNEIRIMKKLNHQYLIKLHEVHTLGESLVIIMEYIEGKSLTEKIKKYGIYNEEKASQFMFNLLKAVEYLHKLNIIHKDIKPENILLANSSDNTKIKLADFGLSAFDYFDSADIPCGTIGYLAPEIFKKKQITKKLDIYSCGLILYFILSGKHAFWGPNKDEIYKNNKIGVINFSAPIWQNISNTCKNFLKELLAENPGNRPTATEALKSSWFSKKIHEEYSESCNEIEVSEICLSSTIAYINEGLNSDGAIGCRTKCRNNFKLLAEYEEEKLERNIIGSSSGINSLKTFKNIPGSELIGTFISTFDTLYKKEEYINAIMSMKEDYITTIKEDFGVDLFDDCIDENIEVMKYQKIQSFKSMGMLNKPKNQFKEVKRQNQGRKKKNGKGRTKNNKIRQVKESN